MMERLKRTLSVLMLLPLVLVVGCGSMVEVKIVTKVATLEPVHALVISGASAPTSTPASPTPTRTPYPTYTPHPAYKYPAPELMCPLDEAVFLRDQMVKLMWETPVPLGEDEWYEVRLSRPGELPTIWWVKEGTLKIEREIGGMCPGRCWWGVRIVRGQEEDRAERYLSPSSWTWGFRIEAPWGSRHDRQPDPCLVPTPTRPPMPTRTPIPTPRLWP
jgi:hypothetical protein